MNITQVGPYPLSPDCIRGGVESSVFGLANALAVNHHVDVFDLPRIGGKDIVEKSGNICIHRYINNGRHNQDAIQRVDEVLRDIIALHPDVVHVHGTGKISSMIYQAIKKHGIKVLLTVHGLLHVEKSNLLRKKITLKHIYQYFHQSRIEFDAIEKTDVAIVDTEYVAIQLRQLFKQKKVKKISEMHVIPQGINKAYLSLETNPQDDLILSVGAISERKGHLYLLQAFEQVCALRPSAKLIIAGSLADRQYYDTLNAYVAQSPYKDNITIYTNLPQEDIFALYQKAKIFALHSQEESQGIVFAEAMAVGLPVVATKVGGVPYVVHDTENGLLAEYGDVNAFADNILRLLNETNLYMKIQSRNKQEAIDYDWATIASKVENLYKSL